MPCGAVVSRQAGDFNGWSTTSHACSRDAFGTWSIFIPDDMSTGQPAIPHNSRLKLALLLPHDAPVGGGERISDSDCDELGIDKSAPRPRRAWRLPAWSRFCRYVVDSPSLSVRGSDLVHAGGGSGDCSWSGMMRQRALLWPCTGHRRHHSRGSMTASAGQRPWCGHANRRAQCSSHFELCRALRVLQPPQPLRRQPPAPVEPG